MPCANGHVTSRGNDQSQPVGGRLALADLILLSVFLTDILLLGIMGEINLSGVLLANAAFVLCYVTALATILRGLLDVKTSMVTTFVCY